MFPARLLAIVYVMMQHYKHGRLLDIGELQTNMIPQLEGVARAGNDNEKIT